MGRHANPDIRRAFAEYNDVDTPSKCAKVRCLYCGFVRAKNTTRQIEHLQECQAYQASPEAQSHLADHGGSGDGSQASQAGAPGILNGQHPNPNLQINRRGPNHKRPRDGHVVMAHHGMMGPPAPSLTAHVLTVHREAFEQATQQPFLSHAGCGTLQPGPLQQWLVQDGHFSRGYIRCVGQLLAKVRLPPGSHTQMHPMFRTMDLLISALNNMRREMHFFDITATKFGLVLPNDPPSPVTRGLLDLFISASSSSASLLEGMVVLWGTQHFYRSAWQYAHSFTATLSTPSNDAHIVALHQALIPNWTAPAYTKFIDASRALVDDLANNNSARDGREEMLRCEDIFRQICWLGERYWPDVDGMGEEDDSGRLGSSAMANMGPTMDNAMSPATLPGAAMNSSMNSAAMAGTPMSGQGMRGSDGTPVGDGASGFGSLDNVTQSA